MYSHFLIARDLVDTDAGNCWAKFAGANDESLKSTRDGRSERGVSSVSYPGR